MPGANTGGKKHEPGSCGFRDRLENFHVAYQWAMRKYDAVCENNGALRAGRQTIMRNNTSQKARLPKSRSSQAIILMGVSGSGKTTIGLALAKATGGCFLEGDDFHPAANVRKMGAGIPLQDADRRGWLIRMREAIVGKSRVCPVCFVACSALKKDYRDFLRRAGVDVRFVFLKAPVEVLRRRLQRREGHFMPATLLASQLATLEPPRNAIIADVTQTPNKVCRDILDQLGLAREMPEGATRRKKNKTAP